MKIHDILERDPARNPLVNNGQARISDETDDEKVLAELKGELSSFVCEGQFSEGLHKIINAFIPGLGHTSQKGAWVSGFYGSGKSHLLKMLCHLWQDTEFPDGSTARSIVPAMPADVVARLRELDTLGKREGGLVAAAGTLPSGSSESVRLTILGILLRGVGLPAQYPQARFCLWLHERGFYDSVKTDVEQTGRSFMAELNNLYVSPIIAEALLKCDSDFGASQKEVRATLRAQFADQSDLSTEEFLRTFKEALRLRSTNGKTPCTLLILDEVQQFIGDSSDRSTIVTEVAEAVSKQLDSHVMIVAAGQSALTDIALLQKLMDRFTIRIPLSDTDVETVTRKVLLKKKPSAINEVKKVLESNAGEVSRQLQGTRIGETSSDRNTAVDDYPLLPVRRRFWEHCFRVVDAAGTQSQLRSQLRILHDAVASLSDQDLGAVVPGDTLYEALAPNMVNTGVLLREINERIIGLSANETKEGKLARRICGLAFLIGKLPRDAGADIGVRATKQHIADLMISDLRGDNGKLRSDVGTVIDNLVEDGTLMSVGDEVRLQTREGAEWDSEFRKRQAKLLAESSTVLMKQEQLLYGELDRIVRGLRVTHGQAKVSRTVTIHRDQSPPVPNGDSVILWVRDGFSTQEKNIRDEARSAGSDSPIVHVFIPRQSPDDLRARVVDAEAATQTIDFKGHVSSDEGQEARRGMEGRRDDATRRRDDLVREIVANTKVFQGGGSEVLSFTLDAKIRDAANDSLVRLFPRFKDADASVSAWEAVIKRAKEGADQPFQPLSFSGPTEQHPVCQQVVGTIGAGKTGNEIRKALTSSPFGWPQDAIDAALIALHRLQHLTATLNGQPVALGQLDQSRISKSEFRVEKATLAVPERLEVRKLFSAMGLSCKPGEEVAKAGEFLGAVRLLAQSAGGEAPLPLPPNPPWLSELVGLSGNQQLRGMLDHTADLDEGVKEWKKARALVESRMPVWQTAVHLARHAMPLAEAKPTLDQLNAVRDDRLLLDSSDPVNAVRATLAGFLRAAITESDQTYESEFRKGMETLAQNDSWSKLDDAKRKGILIEVALSQPVKTDVASDETLITSLDRHPLDSRRSAADAVTGRIQTAIEMAAKLLEPEARRISLESTTLRTAEDVNAWIERQQKHLHDAVKNGPVIVG